MVTVIRADWSNVTLAEYAALALLRQASPIDRLNAVWDDMHAHNPFRGDEPARLTDEGVEWITAMKERATTEVDENVLIDLARELVTEMGTLVTMAAVRDLR